MSWRPVKSGWRSFSSTITFRLASTNAGSASTEREGMRRPSSSIDELDGPFVHSLAGHLAQVREAAPHAETGDAPFEAVRRRAAGEERELVPPPRIGGPGEGLRDLLREGRAAHAGEGDRAAVRHEPVDRFVRAHDARPEGFRPNPLQLHRPIRRRDDAAGHNGVAPPDRPLRGWRSTTGGARPNRAARRGAPPARRAPPAARTRSPRSGGPGTRSARPRGPRGPTLAAGGSSRRFP